MTTKLVLHNGDCLEVMATFEDNSIDIVICDLPYGRFKHLDWDKAIDLDRMWEQLWRICKPTTPIFLFGDFLFANILLNSQHKHFKFETVWNKEITTTPFLSKKRPGKATEYILAFYKRQPVYNIEKYHTKTYNPTHKKDKSYEKGVNISRPDFNGKKYEPTLPINVIECKIKRLNKTIKAVTEKPQHILEHLLKYWSNEGDVCLDFTMGSGSCGVACHNLNRKFIGIEMNKEHFDAAEERLRTQPAIPTEPAIIDPTNL